MGERPFALIAFRRTCVETSIRSSRGRHHSRNKRSHLQYSNMHNSGPGTTAQLLWLRYYSIFLFQFIEPVLEEWVLVEVQRRDGIVPQRAVLDDERRRLAFDMAQEEDVVPDTEPHHQVQLRLLSVEDFRLQDRIAYYISRHVDLPGVKLPAQARHGDNREAVVLKDLSQRLRFGQKSVACGDAELLHAACPRVLHDLVYPRPAVLLLGSLRVEDPAHHIQPALVDGPVLRKFQFFHGFACEVAVLFRRTGGRDFHAHIFGAAPEDAALSALRM